MNYVKRIADIMAYALCAVVLAALISLAFYVGAHAAECMTPDDALPAAQCNDYAEFVTRSLTDAGKQCDKVASVWIDTLSTAQRVTCIQRDASVPVLGTRVESYAIIPGFNIHKIADEAEWLRILHVQRVTYLKFQLGVQ